MKEIPDSIYNEISWKDVIDDLVRRDVPGIQDFLRTNPELVGKFYRKLSFSLLDDDIITVFCTGHKSDPGVKTAMLELVKNKPHLVKKLLMEGVKISNSFIGESLYSGIKDAKIYSMAYDQMRKFNPSWFSTTHPGHIRPDSATAITSSFNFFADAVSWMVEGTYREFFEMLVNSNLGVFMADDWDFFLKFNGDDEKLREVYNRARDALIVKSVHQE